MSFHIFSSNVSGTLLIEASLQYLGFSPGSACTKSGFKSKSSRLGDPLLTCFNKSVLPITSFKELKPSDAKISLTSVATKVKKFTTFSGVPVNFSLSFLS